MFWLCIGTRYLLLMDIDTGAESPNGKIGSWLGKNAIVLRFFSQLRSIASMNNCSFIEPISSIRTHVIITNFFRLNSNSCSLDFFQFKVWKFTFTMQFRFYGEWILLFVPIEPEKKQSSKKTQNWFHNSIKLNWKKNIVRICVLQTICKWNALMNIRTPNVSGFSIGFYFDCSVHQKSLPYSIPNRRIAFYSDFFLFKFNK